MSTKAQHNNNDKLNVLVIDDDHSNLAVIDKTLAAQGFNVTTKTSAEEALHLVDKKSTDVILLDVMMPGMDGFEACRILKTQPETRLIPVIIITALQEKQDRITGIEAGCDDFLSKPIDRLELVARVRALGRVKRLNDELDHAEDVVMSFARAVEAKDGTTGDHCDRLMLMAAAFGESLSLDEYMLRTLQRASILHDVGKIGIPDAILLKPGKLTNEEWDIMKRHPSIGEEICKPLKSLQDVLPIIRHHHEKWNGAGYPDGLKGENIPYLARVFQIIDAYDAMTSKRPYKQAFSTEDTLALLKDETKKGLWDPELIPKFIEFIEAHRGEYTLGTSDK